MERRNFFRTLGLALAGSALIPHEQIEAAGEARKWDLAKAESFMASGYVIVVNDGERVPFRGYRVDLPRNEDV